MIYICNWFITHLQAFYVDKLYEIIRLNQKLYI